MHVSALYLFDFFFICCTMRINYPLNAKVRAESVEWRHRDRGEGEKRIKNDMKHFEWKLEQNLLIEKLLWHTTSRKDQIKNELRQNRFRKSEAKMSNTKRNPNEIDKEWKWKKERKREWGEVESDSSGGNSTSERNLVKKLCGQMQLTCTHKN